MKKLFTLILAGTLAVGFAFAEEDDSKAEKKNPPKKSDAEKVLQKLGEEHFPKGMKVRVVGSLKADTTYFHIFSGALKGNYLYRVIVFDNTPTYLGYYELDREPSDYEPGAVIFNVSDTSSNKIHFSKEKGPNENPRIEGVLVKFQKAPEPEKKKVSIAGKGTDPDGGETAVLKPEFRNWKITLKGKDYNVRAIYVTQTFGTVTLRAEASGAENEFPISAISKEDQKYIEQFK